MSAPSIRNISHRRWARTSRWASASPAAVRLTPPGPCCTKPRAAARRTSHAARLWLQARCSSNCSSETGARAPPALPSDCSNTVRNRFSSAVFKRSRRSPHRRPSTPCCGANSTENRKIAVPHNTIVGPVGKLASLSPKANGSKPSQAFNSPEEIAVPSVPVKAPITPDSSSIRSSRSVQKRAVAPGRISIAAINTTPTAGKPITVIKVNVPIIVMSRARVGQPWARAKPRSKLNSLNSL